MPALNGIQVNCGFHVSNKPQESVSEKEEETEDSINFDQILNQMMLNQFVTQDKAGEIHIGLFDGDKPTEVESVGTSFCKVDKDVEECGKSKENSGCLKLQGSNEKMIEVKNYTNEEEGPLKVEQKEISSIINFLEQKETILDKNNSLEQVGLEEHKINVNIEKLSFKDSMESENRKEEENYDGVIERHIDKSVSMKINEPELPKMISTNTSDSPIKNLDEVYVVIRKGMGQGKDKEKTTLTVKLHPEELGNLKIQLEVKDGAIKGNILVDNESAKNALQSHLPDMKEQLRNQGLSIESLDVSLEQQFHQEFSESAEERNRYVTKQFEHKLSRNEIRNVLYEKYYMGINQRLNILV